MCLNVYFHLPTSAAIYLLEKLDCSVKLSHGFCWQNTAVSFKKSLCHLMFLEVKFRLHLPSRVLSRWVGGVLCAFHYIRSGGMGCAVLFWDVMMFPGGLSAVNLTITEVPVSFSPNGFNNSWFTLSTGFESGRFSHSVSPSNWVAWNSALQKTFPDVVRSCWGAVPGGLSGKMLDFPPFIYQSSIKTAKEGFFSCLFVFSIIVNVFFTHLFFYFSFEINSKGCSFKSFWHNF